MIDAKERYDSFAKLVKDHKEREANKHVYDAIAAIKKLKIPELKPLIEPIIQKEGYIEFNLEKPEIGRYVSVEFNCLDSKSDRSDSNCQKTLQKLIKDALKDTNWRLMIDGVHYRLGYLNGRLRAYENEDDLLSIVAIKTKT